MIHIEEPDKLEQLLRDQELHLQKGPRKAHNEEPQTATEEKSNENKGKVVSAVKEYLTTHSFLLNCTLESAITEFERPLLYDTNGEPLRSDQQQSIICDPTTNRYALKALSRPLYHGAANGYFCEDPEMGYMTIIRAIEEILVRKEIEFPTQIKIPRENSYPGLSLLMKFNREGKYQGSASPKHFVLFTDHVIMLDGLTEDFERRQEIPRTDPVDRYYKLPETKRI